MWRLRKSIIQWVDIEDNSMGKFDGRATPSLIFNSLNYKIINCLNVCTRITFVCVAYMRID